MHVTHAAEFSDVVMFAHERAAIYIYDGHHVNVCDPKNLRILSKIALPFSVNIAAQMLVDTDFIYMASDGDIWAIDKFNGEMVAKIPCGHMIVTHPIVQSEDAIFTVCGVPITIGLHTGIDNYCINRLDKKDHKKTNQSQLMHGKVRGMLRHSGYNFCLINKLIYMFDSLCELILNVPTSRHRISPLESGFVAYDHNMADIWSNQDHRYGFAFTHKIEGIAQEPIEVDGSIYWVMPNHLRIIHPTLRSFVQEKMPEIPSTNFARNEQWLYSGSANGNLIKFNTRDLAWVVSRTNQNSFEHVFIEDDALFLKSGSKIVRTTL